MSAPSRSNIDIEEAQELRDKIWTIAQRLALLMVVFIAGLLVGLIKPTTVAPAFKPLGIQGPAGQLQEKVEQLEERNRSLLKERDTLNSKAALIERDKKEIERKMQEAEARAAACDARDAQPAG